MVIGIANKHNKTPAQVRSCNNIMFVWLFELLTNTRKRMHTLDRVIT